MRTSPAGGPKLDSLFHLQPHELQAEGSKNFLITFGQLLATEPDLHFNLFTVRDYIQPRIHHYSSAGLLLIL